MRRCYERRYCAVCGYVYSCGAFVCAIGVFYLVPERKLAFFHDSANSLSLTPAIFRRRSVNFLFWWCSMVQIRYSGRILAAPFPCFVLFSATSRAFRPLFCKGLVVERLLVVLARGAWRPNAEYCVPRWRGPRSA